MNPASATSRFSRVYLGFILAAAGAGIWLRAYQLGIQVILDDEWHAVHKLLRAGYANIATHFGFADYSIPLTLYFRFLHDHGGLSEWGMHLPPLIAGSALLLCGPALLRRWIDHTAIAAWVALLALSPLLVYLSKTARPYALTGLLTFIAIVAFRRWWREDRGSTAWASAYVGATCLAAWLHLITLPYTLLPFAYYGLRTLSAWRLVDRRSSASRELLRLVGLGLATLLPLLALLLPPLIADWTQFSAKAGTDAVTSESVYRTLLMLCGTASPAVLAVFVLLAITGARSLSARDRDLVAYLCVVVVGGTAAIAAAKPAWIHHPAVLARYCVPVLPFVLLFVAEGVSWILVRIKWVGVRLGLLTLSAAVLVFAGPLPSYLYFPNQFFGHLRFQYDYDDRHNPYVQLIPPDPIPAFYRDLSRRPPGSVTLIEAPWRLESNFNPHPWYQRLHRQFVRIGLVTPICGEHDFGEFPESPAMRFRQFAHLSAILRGDATGAQYLVLHRYAWKTPPDAGVEWPDMGACIGRVEASLGAPIVDDGQIVVFELKR